MEMFLTESKGFTHFGVIIGPSGCGKTYAVRDICNKFPTGVLYHEIEMAETFASGLAKEIGMKLSPTTAFDVLLSYISPSYCHYHCLEDCHNKALEKVLGVLVKAATTFKTKYKKTPVLFINGIDILTKRDEVLCEALITKAKILANSNTLRIVLISSEGSIMPILERLSASNRAIIYEVGDLRDMEALKYLIENGVGIKAAKESVNCVGGRLVYLQDVLTLKQDVLMNVDQLCASIEELLFKSAKCTKSNDNKKST